MKRSIKTFALLAGNFLAASASLSAQDSTPAEPTPIGNSSEAISLDGSSLGDENINTHWTLGTGLMYGLPLQGFDPYYRDGVAWHIEVFTPSLLPEDSELHLKLGAHADALFSGRETVEITLQDPAGVRADYGITNASVGGHLIARLTTKPRKVMPYLDGIIGGRWLFSTEEIVMQEQLPDYESVVVESLSDHPTFIFGGSLGAMVKIGRFSYLDFRVTYSHGSRANYIDLSTVEGTADAVYFQESESKTPLLFTNIGVVWQLGGRPSQPRNNYSIGMDSTPSYGIFGIFRSSNRSSRRSNNNEYCAPGDSRQSNRATKKPSIKKNPPKKKPGVH